MSDVNKPGWYRDAIIYEAHVRAFYDSNGDGIGDFKGLTEKLDYLQDLGVTALWLLPFYPSPLRDEGYDIGDYFHVHPNYGTLRDFKTFLEEANRRGLNVITELVVNHTSDQHPWFQRARRAPPGSDHRNYYVWSDSQEKYKEARIIFKDFEASNWTYDKVAKAYYWHRFYAHQPDLNFEHPAVKKSIVDVLDYWLGIGVSGLRLDAVPYLYEQEGTNCENLPQTHVFLRELRRHVDTRFKGRMLLAEANQWPQDAAAYFGKGDECHMNFHFPLMPRLFMAIRMEDSFPIQDILEQTPAIPEGSQWAVFLRNHDELTLEMVTEEERDYMWRVYAHDPKARLNLGIRRRLAPLMSNDRRKIELMNVLLFSMPGTPVLYYGDEIGMGDNYHLADRNGVRTPMQWNGRRNAGFSTAGSRQLYLPVITDAEYHYAAVNVEAQEANPDSLLWWMKRLIAVRRQNPALGRGRLEFLETKNRKVVAFLSHANGQTVLVVANLSRLAQHVRLPLARFKGRRLMELFGHAAVPRIGDEDVPVTLTPDGYLLFSREASQRERAVIRGMPDAPAMQISGEWREALSAAHRGTLEERLLAYVIQRRWFGGKARMVQMARVEDVVEMSGPASRAAIVFLRIDYTDGEPDRYQVPIAFASGLRARAIRKNSPQAVIALVKSASEVAQGILFDATHDPGFCASLVKMIGRGQSCTGEEGKIAATPHAAFSREVGDLRHLPPGTPLRGEQTNTSLFFGRRAVLKLFRRLDEGTNPDLELGRFLTERTSFASLPPVIGAIEYRRSRKEEPVTLAVLKGYAPAQGDAWTYALDELGRFYHRVLARGSQVAPGVPRGGLLSLAGAAPPLELQGLIGDYLTAAQVLGERTAEMHLALASQPADPVFAPEPFGPNYQRALFQALRGNCLQAMARLREQAGSLDTETRVIAERVLGRESAVVKTFEAVIGLQHGGMRIRVHGDYHLGQVLRAKDDFIIIDFEGEPARSIGWRRLKRSPLRDVAGMLRSFDYAASYSLRNQSPPPVRTQDTARLLPWAKLWTAWVSAAFLRSYLDAIKHSGLLPQSDREIAILLDALLLEKALYEVTYELNNRPDWVAVPLTGILDLLDGGA